MSDEQQRERGRVLREVRQRLESLGRAGVDRIPAPVILEFAPLVSSLAATLEVPALAPASAPRGEVEPVRRPVPTPAPTPRVAVPAEVEPVRRPAAPPPPPRAPIVLPPSSLFGASERGNSIVPPAERPAQLAALAAEISGCQRCPHLAASRTQTVFGTGSATARLMFIGEAPGADEDRTGEPFVGRAGMLLTDMITKGMGLQRSEVYIANVLKSRPPENRDPTPDEIAHCLPYLDRQIEIVRPEFLCLLGRTAAQALLETALSLTRLRGKWHRCRGVLTMVTYHPSYLLRYPAYKKDAWDDLQMLMKQMGLNLPTREKR
ncbi:DNA polymerase [Singulisphaera sp. GP187]|uniref:uracil-DNA glycosylase n=1 Tax=Singulisphaera sp. GP187 TaxID=1882752 RepID=UPI00092BB2D4|nr:uracil-DNA glycosylase [Singulisphaera sp. GP187]SIO58530.1 DNA polymerase [Singulisphaera sp. GP187]